MSLSIASLAESQIQEYSKKIDFYTSEYTVEILAKKMASGEYEVPSYQRAFTWDQPRKSKFIESLLIGLPIPFLFFWTEPSSGILEVVDGSQRLRTLEEYLSNKLVLKGLERLTMLNDTKFSDLSLSRQRKVLNKSIRGIILSEDTDLEARIDLFERINTGSKVANSAEVRQGALRGPFIDFIARLKENEKFISLAPVTPKQAKEREREELISRFFAYSDGLDEYKDNVRPFIFNYIKNMNARFEEHPELENSYRERFQRMLDFVERTFELGFRKSAGAKTTPRTRYEAIAIGSHLALEERPNLVVPNVRATEILNSKEFTDVIRSDGANAKRLLSGRINFIKNALINEA